MTNLNRRKFLQSTAITGCAVLMAAKFNPLSAFNHLAEEDKIDPKLLNYCGYTCPSDCKFMEATKANDPALKKEAYDIWHIKERYGFDFDPETAICYGCKATDKPEGVVVKGCTVRSCAKEKEIDACIQCDELKSCDQDLWKRFPDFHKAIIEMQEKYRA